MLMFTFRLLTAILALCVSSASAFVVDRDFIEERQSGNRLVFAHLIVGITSNRQSANDWDADMLRAKSYGIDAFALNIGTDSYTDTQLGYAYSSAAKNGMKVFISFDFAFWKTSDATAVGQKIAQYAAQSAQLMVDNKVFVSSFIGDGVDVATVRSAAGTPIYFAPNFVASQSSLASVDGALNWQGWPSNGANRAPTSSSNVTVQAGDNAYIQALNGKGYIAPASPWFFTHYGTEVSYSKNWLFPGELLWFQRWSQLLTTGSRFIEIVSWNDYGESHYTGPLSSPHTDDGASKWVNDMPHTGWLDMAKPYIAAYKAGATSVNSYITSDQLIYWYRPQPMTENCNATDTCMGASSNPDYYVGKPNGWQTVSDSVFVVSLLTSAGTLGVSSGSNSQTFSAPAGANAYVIPMGIGQQKFNLTRNSQVALSATSLKNIIDGCVCGLYNFNAYVGTVPAGSIESLSGNGYDNFNNGLKVSCAASPSLTSTSTTSTTTTTAPTTTTTTSKITTTTTTNPATTIKTTTTTTTTPTTTTIKTTTTTTTTTPTNTIKTTTTTTTIKTTTTTTTTTTPPPTTTTTTPPPTTTTSTPSSSAVCQGGTGAGNYQGLCNYACNYGYCPSGPCTCTTSGTPKPTPPPVGTTGAPLDGEDQSYAGLCSFACDKGYCPSSACKVVSACQGGSGPGNYAGLCSFCCNYGYCPAGPCMCSTTTTAPQPTPSSTGQKGVPLDGEDSSYAGLCSFACDKGYCPNSACKVVQ